MNDICKSCDLYLTFIFVRNSEQQAVSRKVSVLVGVPRLVALLLARDDTQEQLHENIENLLLTDQLTLNV